MRHAGKYGGRIGCVEVEHTTYEGVEIYAPFRVEGNHYPATRYSPEEYPEFILEEDLAVNVTPENEERLRNMAIEKWVRLCEERGEREGWDDEW